MDGAPSILISPSTETRGSEFSDYSLNLSHAYTQAIIKAVGVPMVIPCETNDEFVAEAVRRCDGVMISGGEDLQPELYSAELKPGLRETVGPTDPPPRFAGIKFDPGGFSTAKAVVCDLPRAPAA